MNIASIKGKAQYVVWFHENDRRFKFKAILKNILANPPTGVKCIKSWWYHKFKDSSSIDDRKRMDRPSSRDDTIDVVRTAFQRSSRISTRRASRELGVLQGAVVKILHQRLCLRAQKV